MKKLYFVAVGLLLSTLSYAQTTRVPLHEVFSSSTCPPCVPANQNLEIIDAQANGSLKFVKYQMNWPGNGDPYYNPDGATRKTYYGVTGVPYMVIDGTINRSAASYSLSALNNYINTASSTLAMSATLEYKAPRTINAKVRIDALAETPGNNRVFIAIIEKKTTRNASTNGETEFHHVMQKMLPNGSGTFIGPITDLSAPILIDESYTFPSINKVEEFTDLAVVAWVQNYSTKEIYQATYEQFLLGTEGVVAKTNQIFSVNAFPNYGQSKIYFNMLNTNNVQLEITDMTGKVVLKDDFGIILSGEHDMVIKTGDLSAGIYLAKLKIGNETVVAKFPVIK